MGFQGALSKWQWVLDVPVEGAMWEPWVQWPGDQGWHWMSGVRVHWEAIGEEHPAVNLNLGQVGA